MSSTTLLRLTNNVSNLEYVVKEILRIRKEDGIKHATQDQIESIPEEERIFISLWQSCENYDNISNIKLPNGSSIRFLVKEAHIESSKITRNMFEDGKLLPKDQRTIFDTVKVIFFEYTTRVYVIVFSAYTPVLNKIKQRLFDEEEHIDSLDIRFNISSDLFYWLFYKYVEKNRLLAERFEVEAISGFLGNIADETHVIKGESEVVPSLLVTKAFVSKFHPIRSLNVMLKFDDYRLSFIFNDISQCSISSSCSIPNNQYDLDVTSAIIIYAFTIPFLSQLFKDDRDWSVDKKTTFAKKIGEEVIREIADFHGIDLKQL